MSVFHCNWLKPETFVWKEADDIFVFFFFFHCFSDIVSFVSVNLFILLLQIFPLRMILVYLIIYAGYIPSRVVALLSMP